MITLIKSNSNTGKKSLRHLSLEVFILQIKRENPYVRQLRRFVEDVLETPGETHGSFSDLDKIPRVYPSIVHRRKGRDIFLTEEYNGVIMLEISQLTGMVKAESIKQQAAVLPSTLAAFVGSSGRSVKIWVRYALPDGLLPKGLVQIEAFHKEACLIALGCYSSILSQSPEVKDVTSMTSCCVTEDTHPLFYPEALPLRIFDRPDEFHQLKMKEQNGLLRLEPVPDNTAVIFRHFRSAVKKARQQLSNWERGDNPKELLPVLAEECFKSGIPEEEAYYRIGQYFFRWYADDATAKRTMETVVAEIYKTNGKEKETMLAIDRFMKKKVDLRYNAFTDCVEVRRKISTDYTFRPLTQRLQNTLSIQAMNESIPSWDRDINRYLNSEFVPVFNPVDDYFNHLEKWDGVDRITDFFKRIPTANPYFPLLFRRWLLSMVAHWRKLDKRHANSTIPVLIGGQGTGKSTFCRNLLPPELRFAYTDRLDFTNKKDAERYLSKFLLINIDEYDQLSSRQQAFMKYLLSAPSTHSRQMFGTTMEEHWRYASFIATSNVKELLNDPTGSRRYLCVEVTGEIDNTSPVNYSQLYAQAVECIRLGERTWFDKEDERLVNEGNKEFEVASPVLGRFWQHFRLAKAGEDCEELTADTILQKLTSKSERTQLGIHYNVTFGRLLRKLNVPVRHTKYGNAYRCVRL